MVASRRRGPGTLPCAIMGPTYRTTRSGARGGSGEYRCRRRYGGSAFLGRSGMAANACVDAVGGCQWRGGRPGRQRLGAHRPDSLTSTDNGLVQSPSIALCRRAAPPVAHFSLDGKFRGGFGGPASAPTIGGVNQWPISLHGISVDGDGSFRFAGIGKGDHMVMKYARDGKFIRKIGRRGETGGNADSERPRNPSEVTRVGNQVIVADGYINCRFLRFDGASGRPWASGERMVPRLRPGRVRAASTKGRRRRAAARTRKRAGSARSSTAPCRPATFCSTSAIGRTTAPNCSTWVRTVRSNSSAISSSKARPAGSAPPPTSRSLQTGNTCTSAT